MKKTQYLAIVLIVIGLILIAGCGPAETPAPSVTEVPEVHPGQKIVANSCITCHTLGVVENKRFDSEGWKKTVEQMVLNGAQLDAEQQQLAIEYLAINFPKE
jgi:mono/diheme cytochrome c family protein